MGLCLTAPARDSHSNRSETLSSTPGTSSNNSKNVGFSGTSSTVGRSQFSEAASVDVDEPYQNGQILDHPNLKEYSFSDLRATTKNFKPETLLGQGGFGKVYKGWVDETSLAPCKSYTGMVVAIKKLNPESVQGFQEWEAEVNFLGRLSHPNLVRLLGFCCEDKELLLVYEFMPKGSLENHLFRRNPSVEPLSWEKRLKIAIGAARGLAFLHDSEKKVIYRDFKTSNILLDMNYNAKISDFGLAKLGPAGEQSHVTTRIMGTNGYVAPEYVSTGHLYVKSDVYGFGVVLLELISGLRAFDVRRPPERRKLVDWATPILMKKGKVKTLMDARIKGQYSLKTAAQVGDLTLKCLETDPKHRPSMQEVSEVLERIQNLGEKPKAKIGNSHSAPPHQGRSNNASQPVKESKNRRYF